MLTSQTGGGKTLNFIYEENIPTALEYDGTEYYYVTNLQGDVIAILDNRGECVVEYTYDAWGKLLSTTGNLAGTLGKDNPLRYRGYYYDTETGLYYLQSRYYDPTVGRFINADEITYMGMSGSALGYNLFSYCENNAVNHSDPFGTWIRNYKGFSKTNVGFNVNMNFKFLNKNFCKDFADKFLKLYGSYTWWRGWRYSGMSKTRIAKELYAHAVLYCIGVGLLTTAHMSQMIKPYLKGIKKNLINKIIRYASEKLGRYLYDHSRIINVNSDEAWYKVIVFDYIWNRM